GGGWVAWQGGGSMVTERRRVIHRPYLRRREERSSSAYEAMARVHRVSAVGVSPAPIDVVPRPSWATGVPRHAAGVLGEPRDYRGKRLSGKRLQGAAPRAIVSASAASGHEALDDRGQKRETNVDVRTWGPCR